MGLARPLGLPAASPAAARRLRRPLAPLSRPPCRVSLALVSVRAPANLDRARWPRHTAVAPHCPAAATAPQPQLPCRAPRARLAPAPRAATADGFEATSAPTGCTAERAIEAPEARAAERRARAVGASTSGRAAAPLASVASAAARAPPPPAHPPTAREAGVRVFLAGAAAAVALNYALEFIGSLPFSQRLVRRFIWRGAGADSTDEGAGGGSAAGSVSSDDDSTRAAQDGADASARAARRAARARARAGARGDPNAAAGGAADDGGEPVEWVNMCWRKAWRVYQRGLERWLADLLQVRAVVVVWCVVVGCSVFGCCAGVSGTSPRRLPPFLHPLSRAHALSNP
jgi:hypothetical protein